VGAVKASGPHAKRRRIGVIHCVQKGMKMAIIEIELSDNEQRQLQETAAGRELTAPALAQRWVRERLVHERERAAGGGRPMSPRAQREQQDRS
jgi:hypothetical protein